VGYRVAIILSGQSRSYKTALDNIARFFGSVKQTKDGEEIFLDYFFHTWDTNQWLEKGSDKLHMHEIPYEPANVDIDFIKSKVNLVDYEIQTFDFDKYNVPWGGLLYSFYKSNHIKRKYELTKGFKYDQVIRTRFDIAYYPEDKFYYLSRPVRQFLYTASHYGRLSYEFNSYNFDDVWFYSDSQTMDMVANVYNYVGEQMGKNYMRKTTGSTFHLTESLLGPGCLLNRFSNLINIQAAKEPGQPGSWAVVRKSALDKNIDTVNDYSSLQKINIEYYEN
jgi:hypothetical protein